MKYTVKKEIPSLKPDDTLIFFLYEKPEKLKVLDIPELYKEHLSDFDLSFFKGKQSETIFFPSKDKANILICGLGKGDKVSADSLRNSASSIVDFCRGKSIDDIHVVIPENKTLGAEEALLSIAEGMSLTNYDFDKYKSDKDAKNPLIGKVTLISNAKNAGALLKDMEIISANTLLCRDLINESSSKKTSEDIASEAKKLAKLKNVTCTVLGKNEISRLKMGLLQAVNRGSKYPPKFVILKYNGDKSSKSYFAFVGKGITFDSGGYNLKPTGSIEEMRMDMSGAAAVLYTIKTAAELNLKKNVYGVLPLTDNMVSSDAYRPGDIFTAFNKKNVEIGNTDAEGRLILADALAYTEKKLKPACIVDTATLTGACLIALGESVAAYLTEDDDLKSLVEDASEKTGDKVWRLPFVEEYEENMKSDHADIKNISNDRKAGTIMAAIFLKNFIEKTKWMHIDIAGTAWYSKKRGYRPKNATGYGVRLFIEMLKNWKG